MTKDAVMRGAISRVSHNLNWCRKEKKRGQFGVFFFSSFGDFFFSSCVWGSSRQQKTNCTKPWYAWKSGKSLGQLLGSDFTISDYEKVADEPEDAPRRSQVVLVKGAQGRKSSTGYLSEPPRRGEITKMGNNCSQIQGKCKNRHLEKHGLKREIVWNRSLLSYRDIRTSIIMLVHLTERLCCISSEGRPDSTSNARRDCNTWPST